MAANSAMFIGLSIDLALIDSSLFARVMPAIAPRTSAACRMPRVVDLDAHSLRSAAAAKLVLCSFR